MPTSWSIPVRGDEVFRRAIRQYANERGVFIADIVRDALDCCYGEELKPYLSFFAERVSGTQQNGASTSHRNTSDNGAADRTGNGYD